MKGWKYLQRLNVTQQIFVVAGKSLPVHCLVEIIYTVDDNAPLHWRRRPIIEIDSYVIIPVTTCFTELVQVALNRLGYSPDSAAAAKGSYFFLQRL